MNPDITPDEFAALMPLAGLLYGESRKIEQETTKNPVINQQNANADSHLIRNQLLQLEQAVRYGPPQQYTPPAPTYHVPVSVPAPPAPVAPISIAPPPIEGAQQLEMQFDDSKAAEMITLLKEISSKLTKIERAVLKLEPKKVKTSDTHTT